MSKELNLNPLTAKLVYTCNECTTDYDLEWLLTQPRSDEGYFICTECLSDDEKDEAGDIAVFAIKQIE